MRSKGQKIPLFSVFFLSHERQDGHKSAFRYLQMSSLRVSEPVCVAVGDFAAAGLKLVTKVCFGDQVRLNVWQRGLQGDSRVCKGCKGWQTSRFLFDNAISPFCLPLGPSNC